MGVEPIDLASATLGKQSRGDVETRGHSSKWTPRTDGLQLISSWRHTGREKKTNQDLENSELQDNTKIRPSTKIRDKLILETGISIYSPVIHYRTKSNKSQLSVFGTASDGEVNIDSSHTTNPMTDTEFNIFHGEN